MIRLDYIILGVLLDFVLGDPYSFPHPVRLMGNLIGLEERIFRKGKHLRAKGLGLGLFNIGLCFGLVSLLLKVLSPYKYAYALVYIYLVYTSLAAKSLDFEASKVKQALGQGLDQARYQLSFIVGRQTQDLSREEIIKACVETVAENTSDGVIAPLFYTLILGPAGGLSYKMVNTMDSMLGYKSEKYIDYGRYPALIDDLFNYLPARITGLLMCLVGLFFGENAFRIMFRDQAKHLSPNAGYPESAVAGILGIQLGGDSLYHGKLVKKASLGDGKKQIQPSDIDTTIRLMYCTEILFLILSILLINQL